MSAHDDVRVDLANRPGLTRSQLEQVVTLLDRTSVGSSGGIALAVTLRSLLPDAGRRLASASATERNDYLRALERVIKGTLHHERSVWTGLSV